MGQDGRAGQATQRVVLTGFMGSGKTTVGRLLAARMGWRFADLDEVVAKRCGLSVPEIFRVEGEGAFRAMEVAALQEMLREEGLVLALGGGAVETAALRQLLATSEGTRVVYLQAPFEVLYERCVRQAMDPGATARPLLGSREAAEERHRRREALYVEAGKIQVMAALPTPDAVAEAVRSALEV